MCYMLRPRLCSGQGKNELAKSMTGMHLQHMPPKFVNEWVEGWRGTCTECSRMCFPDPTVCGTSRFSSATPGDLWGYVFTSSGIEPPHSPTPCSPMLLPIILPRSPCVSHGAPRSVRAPRGPDGPQQGIKRDTMGMWGAKVFQCIAGGGDSMIAEVLCVNVCDDCSIAGGHLQHMR
jgi:hypothetical protein